MAFATHPSWSSSVRKKRATHQPTRWSSTNDGTRFKWHPLLANIARDPSDPGDDTPKLQRATETQHLTVASQDLSNKPPERSHSAESEPGSSKSNAPAHLCRSKCHQTVRKPPCRKWHGMAWRSTAHRPSAPGLYTAVQDSQGFLLGICCSSPTLKKSRLAYLGMPRETTRHANR